MRYLCKNPRKERIRMRANVLLCYTEAQREAKRKGERKRAYRDEINSLQIQLSSTQAGLGRAVKEQQEQNSPNHVQRINLISVLGNNKDFFFPFD